MSGRERCRIQPGSSEALTIERIAATRADPSAQASGGRWVNCHYSLIAWGGIATPTCSIASEYTGDRIAIAKAR